MALEQKGTPVDANSLQRVYSSNWRRWDGEARVRRRSTFTSLCSAVCPDAVRNIRHEAATRVARDEQVQLILSLHNCFKKGVMARGLCCLWASS